MTYEQIENRIAEILAPLNTQGFRVFVMPEKLSDLDLRRHEKGRITILYQDSNFKESKSLDYIVQDETMTIQLICTATELRGDFGMYEMVRKAKDLLIGERVDNLGGRFRLVSDKMGAPQGFEENLWHRVVTINVDGHFAQKVPAETGPLLTAVEFDEEINDYDVGV